MGFYDILMQNHSGKCDGCGRPIDKTNARNIDWRLYCSTQCWQQNKEKFNAPEQVGIEGVGGGEHQDGDLRGQAPEAGGGDSPGRPAEVVKPPKPKANRTRRKGVRNL